uniref:hypothetical protein n=1 Tax=Nonomuraea pusilla TaxID=46177 RepID=UPI0006E20528|nr:hypothetical protein [Nonomuraea pusilla]
MPRPLLVAAALAGAALLSGCRQDLACTAIGTPVGVALTVEPPIAARARTADLSVCWDDSCRTPPMDLLPATRAGAQTCAGDSCSVPVEPTGGKHGFAAVEGLPKRPVRVRLVLRDAASRPVLDRTVQVTPRGRFPNGPECGEGGPNVDLTVEPDGTVRER